MSKSLFAWTPPGSNYPPYLNVTKNDAGEFVITVRSPASEDGACGNTATVKLPAEMVTQLRLAFYDDN